MYERDGFVQSINVKRLVLTRKHVQKIPTDKLINLILHDDVTVFVEFKHRST